ncbi:Ankyrin-1, partial [Diplodia seriata]
ATLDWIWSPDFHHKQEDNRNKRHPSTGSAFLRNPKLVEWIEGKHNTLACIGGPGVGKTLLISILYDHLRERFPCSDTAVVAVYLDFNQPDKHSWTAFSASLSKHPNRLKATEEEYDAFLESQLSHFPRIFVLVDALDEANDTPRALLLKRISGLQKRWPKVKVLSTSRYWHGITDALRLDIDSDEYDMRKCIERELEKNDHWAHNASLDTTFIDDMLDRIVKAAQRIFLMIRLSLEALFEGQTRKEVRETLKKLPDTMDKAYDDVVDRIRRDDRNKKRAIEILSWVLYGLEPISATGIRHALAVDLEEKAFDEDDLIPESLLLSSCKGLVIIGQQGGLLHLSHETVHKYLKKHENVLFSNCHTVLAEKCLVYLSQGEVPRKSKGEGTSFFEYASRNWGSHVRMAGSDHRLSKVADAFMSDHTKLARSVKCISILQNRVGYYPVHILAYFDLRDMLEQQIGTDESRELFQDLHGGTTLFYAAEANSLAVVDLLLSRGIVDVNLANRRGLTPLLIALRHDSTKVATAIIHHLQTDLERSDTRGFTPLHEAVVRKNHAILRLLLDKGANIGAETTSGRTALGMAMQDTTDWPFEDDIEVGWLKTEYTALHLAAQQGHQRIVRWLLGLGANVNSRDPFNRTPLFDACIRNHLGVVEILLDHGANPDVLDINASRPFEAATKEEICTLLRKRSPRKTPHDLSDLHRAVRADDVDEVGRILDRGDNDPLSSLDVDGNTPLHYAAINGLDRVVSRMVFAGVNLDQGNRYGQTALDAAVWRRAFHKAESVAMRRIVELLGWPAFRRDGALDFVHRVGPEFDKVPLHWAAETGNLAQVELLLAWGSDPDRPDQFGETPLHYAAERGHVEVAERLIPVSAPGRLDSKGFTPLRKARERNKAKTVKLMLPFWTEADVSATDACKKSFKDWAVELKLYNAEAGCWKDLPWGTGGPPVLE